MQYRFLFLLGLAVPISASCLQKLDPDLAAGGALNLPAPAAPACAGSDGFACHFDVKTATMPVGLGADTDGNIVDAGTDPCEKVSSDALSLLTSKCAPCHTPSNPPLNFITDVSRLTTASSPTPSYAPNPRYVVPGKPEDSLIYIRAAINKDMPLQNPLAPSSGLTVSESSVLREWIASCVPGAKPEAGSGGKPSTAGTGGGGDTGGGAPVNAGGSNAGGAGGAGGVLAGSVGGALAGGPDIALAGGGSGGANPGIGGEMESEHAGSGGAAAGGAPSRPCAGLCEPPTVYTLDQQYNTPAVGSIPGCYETLSTLSEITCRSCDGRALRINGSVLNASAGTPVSLTGVMTRSGGYCIQLGTMNPAANFSVR
jgi:hypothetical protein